MVSCAWVLVHELAVGSQSPNGAIWALEAGDRTGTVRHDAVADLVVAQAAQGVEGAADLEGADALVIFAFEEEVDFRSCGRLALEGCADEGCGGLGR